jgi:hypothetical protein
VTIDHDDLEDDLDQDEDDEEPADIGEKLDKYGLSVAQLDVLVACNYGPYSFEATRNEAMNVAEWRKGRMSKDEATKALRDCIDQGWLRIISQSDLDEIQSILRAGQLFGPVYTPTGIGDVDFTVRGAARFQELHRDLYGEDQEKDATYSVSEGQVEHVYCPTLALALKTIDEYKNLATFGGFPKVIVSAPVPVGPWCVRWWQSFPSGYRVDVEYEHPIN